MKKYAINYFFAGGNSNGSSIGQEQQIFLFDDKIDFNYIKKQLKKMAIQNIDNRCPCNESMKVFYYIVCFDSNKNKTYGIKGNIKQSRILKWNIRS